MASPAIGSDKTWFFLVHRSVLSLACLLYATCATSGSTQPNGTELHHYVEAKRAEPLISPDGPLTGDPGCAKAEVEVLVFIDLAGTVTTVKVLKESNCVAFNEQAKRSALNQRWIPATRDGQAIPSAKRYSYHLRLQP